MTKFTFNPLLVVLWPPDGEFRAAIFENNTEFVQKTDPTFDWPIIECENQPRDMRAYGIIWIPIERINENEKAESEIRRLIVKNG